MAPVHHLHLSPSPSSSLLLYTFGGDLHLSVSSFQITDYKTGSAATQKRLLSIVFLRACCPSTQCLTSFYVLQFFSVGGGVCISFSSIQSRNMEECPLRPTRLSILEASATPSDSKWFSGRLTLSNGVQLVGEHWASERCTPPTF